MVPRITAARARLKIFRRGEGDAAAFGLCHNGVGQGMLRWFFQGGGHAEELLRVAPSMGSSR